MNVNIFLVTRRATPLTSARTAINICSQDLWANERLDLVLEPQPWETPGKAAISNTGRPTREQKPSDLSDRKKEFQINAVSICDNNIVDCTVDDVSVVCNPCLSYINESVYITESQCAPATAAASVGVSGYKVHLGDLDDSALLHPSGFRVIDLECVSAYFQLNYSSITKGITAETMGVWVRDEIISGLVWGIMEPYVCVHPLGAVHKRSWWLPGDYWLFYPYSVLCKWLHYTV